MDYPHTAHGVAVPATGQDIINDEHGFTNPNLHRRVDRQTQGPEEVAFRDYTMGVYDGLHLYQTEQRFYHDEESTTCEIP